MAARGVHADYVYRSLLAGRHGNLGIRWASVPRRPPPVASHQAVAGGSNGGMCLVACVLF
eukprot:CAMPEP_0181231200 /NCGR_PEP_ID=MMETSP1096-20121128/34951_1 /TAXON_ID=156174 ORGANISM="Chrysochromulina ericina, Strain CCMP281" /NCGR_SAMPLE_ID=MMETSP1096 /ASSEMBLY_ACC=CAM_ASM_000453 /LENGTH=59 /DNA_ID=CAMNT_0023325169 /DNA_START=95 /DNA_END=271 /DNA_ORIENTATION=+